MSVIGHWNKLPRVCRVSIRLTYLKPAQTWSWAICSSGPCSEQWALSSWRSQDTHTTFHFLFVLWTWVVSNMKRFPHTLVKMSRRCPGRGKCRRSMHYTLYIFYNTNPYIIKEVYLARWEIYGNSLYKLHFKLSGFQYLWNLGNVWVGAILSMGFCQKFIL